MNQKELWNCVKAAYNYSKHADNNPLATLDYDPNWALGPLYFATGDYQYLFEKVSVEMCVFRGWLYCTHPLFWNGEAEVLDKLFELYGRDASKKRGQDIIALYDDNPRAVYSLYSSDELEEVYA